jgi:hypothetical protein
LRTCKHCAPRRKAWVPLPGSAAKDLGVFNIAGALPFSVAPAIAPAILAIGNGSYGVLYAVAGVSALAGAAATVPVKGVRYGPDRRGDRGRSARTEQRPGPREDPAAMVQWMSFSRRVPDVQESLQRPSQS